MIQLGLAGVLALFLPPQEAIPAGGDELKPGLLAVYRSIEDPSAVLTRIDVKPAFTLGRSSPHPRIPPGPFEVVWTGIVRILDDDAITFDAALGGSLKIEVAGETLLEARSERETAIVRAARPFARKPGLYRIRIEYRSLPGVPARVQPGWEGKTFSREPIPAWRLHHVPAELNETARGEARAARGMAAAAGLGCARCHAGTFPGLTDPPPGPSLADVGDRVNRAWMVQWLEDPAKVRPGARMPALFTDDRKGLVERWIVADYLARATSTGARRDSQVAGDHRMGRRHFASVGCAGCHFLPDEASEDQPVPDRIRFAGLNDRLSAKDLVAFLGNPHARYPDGRMPRIPVPPSAARDIAAFLLLWSKPAAADAPLAEPVLPAEIDAVARRLGVRGADGAGQALVREKRCAQCHAGIGEPAPMDVPIREADAGCLAGRTLPRFSLEQDREALAAYLSVAPREKHPSPFEDRRRRLDRLGCFKCHSRDTDRPPPLEEVGSNLGSAWLQMVPFLRTPRLSNAFSKYSREYLAASIRDGVSGVRHGRYTYRMPAFGPEAETILQALAETDGDLPESQSAPPPAPADPTLQPLGPSLAGFEGYSCVSCHIWKGQGFAEPDPGAIGPELTTLTRRVRREWFDRWLEDPARIQPGTVMPQIFKKGHPATLGQVLGGDPAKQRDAMWAYFSKGPDAPAPKPLPPLPLEAPADGPLVAQVPVTLPDKKVVESILVVYPTHDVLVYDMGSLSLRAAFTGARVVRTVRGRIRVYTITGTPVEGLRAEPRQARFLGYDRLPDGVRIRASDREESWKLAGRTLSGPGGTLELPPAKSPPALDSVVLQDAGKVEGSLERPGYRAIAYPRPKTLSGDDLVMPGAIAADPADGRVFVASMKRGELFVIRDPSGDGKGARFEDYTGGLFQEAYSLLAESGALYVLHRRNLTKVTDTDNDGKADRFDRVAALPHGVADTYDYGYGLVRDRTGAFVMSYAPYANTSMPGSGSLIRLVPDGKPEEVAFGFRNPLGWCAGPEGEVFYTDNQGEWVATNKLCHIVPGRFYGFPNSAQKEHAKKPFGRTTVWVPYAWAHSINGVTYDATGGKFGPFAGQFFLAELMFGGAIVRACVEKVNGEYQGACFPFWGRGLMGPLVLTFDPKGRMWVGSITEPGWMAQPDRGAVYRIDFTGEAPFEIREIRVLPQGFRLVFTREVDLRAAADPAAYAVDHHRYEYTGAYGSPELDRTRHAVERVEVAADGRSVDLRTAPLVKDRVYMISARGVKSRGGEPLVHPAGAYTLHEIPAR